jgi:hypothetical protein
VPNSTREGEVNHNVLDEKDAQQMMNGDMNIVVMAPTAYESRLRGMPNVYVWPDMNKHDARYSVTAGAGDGRIPRGPSWVEVGGTPVELEEWFGGLTKSDDHPPAIQREGPWGLRCRRQHVEGRSGDSSAFDARRV